ncbi:MAG: hypothetical protein ACOYJB_03075 [Christensenellaceae bacterium]|jgi:ABC-type sugar transport system substrate-binding protein
MKKILLVVLTVAFGLFAFVGCGGQSPEETAEITPEAVATPTPEPTPPPDTVPEGMQGEKRIAVIGLARNSADMDYIRQLMEGAKKEGEAFGFEVATFLADGQENLAQEVITQCIGAGYNGFIVSEDAAIYSDLTPALSQGFSVVTFGSLSNQPVVAKTEGVASVNMDEALLAQASLDNMTGYFAKDGIRVIRVKPTTEPAGMEEAYAALESEGKLSTLEVVTDEEEPLGTATPAATSLESADPGASASPSPSPEVSTALEEDESDSEKTGEGEENETEEGPEESAEIETTTDVARKILALLPKYPSGNIDAVWCPDAAKAVQVTQMLIDAGRTDIKVFSTGVSESVINMMRQNPEMWISTVSVSPATEGVLCMRLLAKMFGNDDPPMEYSVSGILIKAADFEEETYYTTLAAVIPNWGEAPYEEEYLNTPWMDKLREQHGALQEPEESPEETGEEPSTEDEASGGEEQPSENEESTGDGEEE